MCFRGNSKYHYYGLRIKSSSPLLRLLEDQQHLAMRQQPYSQKQRCVCVYYANVYGVNKCAALYKKSSSKHFLKFSFIYVQFVV